MKINHIILLIGQVFITCSIFVIFFSCSNYHPKEIKNIFFQKKSAICHIC